MKLSIVTSTFNCEKYIKRLCESVRLLHKSNIEYEWIIQDGSSFDTTALIINSFSELNVIIESEPDFGIYDAWNKALLRVSGDVILFLGADDFVNDWTVLFDVSNLDAVNCFGLYNYSHKENEIKDSVIFSDSDFGKKLDLPIHAFPPIPSTLFPASILKNYKFDTTYKYHADGLFLYHSCMHATPFFHTTFLTFMGDDGATSGYENRLSRWVEKFRIHMSMRNKFSDIGFIHVNPSSVMLSGLKFLFRQVFYVFFKR